MKKTLFLLLALLFAFAAVPVDAQTVSDAGHPWVYTFSPRAPWHNDEVAFTLTHSDTTARADTIVLGGLATTGKVQLNRRAPAKQANYPTITLKSDTLIVSWPKADTLTYDLSVTRRKRF